MLGSKNKLLVLFIALMSMFNMVGQKDPEVNIDFMTYLDGTPIPQYGTIEIPENDDVDINFLLTVDNPNLIQGTVRLFTKRFVGDFKQQQGATFFINTSHPSPSWSVNLTLSASAFNTTGGFLYAEMENNGGVIYESEGSYAIEVISGGGGNTCNLPPPNSLNTYLITDTSARILWGGVSGSSGYERQYRSLNNSTWISLGSGVTTASDITGLTPETSYKWRVKTKCANGSFGEWSDEEYFTTLAACNLPQADGLFISELTDTGVVINWNPVPGSTGYQIRVLVLPSGDPANPSITNGPNPHSFRLFNLIPETTYEWSVNGRCSNGVYGTNWSETRQFTTLPVCPEHLDKTTNVNNNEVDIDDSELTFTASNIIFSGGTAEYDTGERLILAPGFHAEAGSNFRAYMEGCTPSLKFSDKKEDLALIEEGKLKTLKLFPNPTRDRFYIESDEPMAEWRITNHFGSLQQGNKLSSGDATKAEVDISNYPTGVYFVTAVFKDGEIVQKMLVKE